MRCDTPVYFQLCEDAVLDPLTGDYSAETITETRIIANVSNSKIDTLKLIYGDIEQGSLTVRLLNHYTDPFNYIRIGDKRYRVDYARRLRTKHIFVVSEVQ